MTQNRQNSTWEDSYTNERQRQVANQGGAEDAKRRMERHQRTNMRNPNRTVVSSYSRDSIEQDTEFNAIASEASLHRRQGKGSSFGERNARATWSSNSDSGFPRSRQSTNNISKIVVAVAIIIVVFVVITLFVRSFMG